MTYPTPFCCLIFMELNLDENQDKVVRNAFAMRLDSSREDAIKTFDKLDRKIGLPIKLSAGDVDKDRIALMARNAIGSLYHPLNLRVCAEEDMKNLYAKCM